MEYASFLLNSARDECYRGLFRNRVDDTAKISSKAHVTNCVVRRAFALCAIGVACGKSPSEKPPTAMERAIAEQLAARVGVPVRVLCTAQAERCRGILPDHSELPIVVEATGDWHIEGLLIVSDPIEAYLREAITELGAAQDVKCVPKIRIVSAGDRIECQLGGGGIAFATIAADGSFTIELALDHATGSARSVEISDRELTEQSRVLETDGGAEAAAPEPEPEDEDE